MTHGPAAINSYTVARATQGLAQFILEEGGQDAGVVIGYDSRTNSQAFAQITATTLAANGIKAYLYDALRPTPMVSYAVRQLGAAAGVTITASHNPKEYNGYKVYGADGSQLAPEAANTVAALFAAVDIFDGVKSCDFDTAVARGEIIILGADMDESYIAQVMAQQVDPTAITSATSTEDFRLVYTPLHGSGTSVVPQVLRRAGLKNLFTVPSQVQPDGQFPTVNSPNPETMDAFLHGIAVAEGNACDLVIATDPDADRVGCVARGKDGQFVLISGNQMGALLLDYIISAHNRRGDMPPRPFAVKTIVTTQLAQTICQRHGVKLYDVLTGFKFIGEVILQNEVPDGGSYLFGFEESYGYLKGTYVRDKDAVVACLLIAEMAAHYKSRNMTLIDALDALLDTYGHYHERTINISFPGADGVQRMSDLMDSLRNAPPASFAGRAVCRLRDYSTAEITVLSSGEKQPTNLPKSNVLYFELEGECAVIVRPSGTEPKVKVYLMAKAENKAAAEVVLDALEREMGLYTV
ncbi:MAG: phospho-sugar mutase, partial [Oscillospiraceae bacterium]|nr:phospho-sugar mutase [Oscillospiraceae bacterium]